VDGVDQPHSFVRGRARCAAMFDDQPSPARNALSSRRCCVARSRTTSATRYPHRPLPHSQGRQAAARADHADTGEQHLPSLLDVVGEHAAPSPWTGDAFFARQNAPKSSSWDEDDRRRCWASVRDGFSGVLRLLVDHPREGVGLPRSRSVRSVGPGGVESRRGSARVRPWLRIGVAEGPPRRTGRRPSLVARDVHAPARVIEAAYVGFREGRAGA
jgi:hypothetical protein